MNDREHNLIGRILDRADLPYVSTMIGGEIHVNVPLPLGLGRTVEVSITPAWTVGELQCLIDKMGKNSH